MQEAIPPVIMIHHCGVTLGVSSRHIRYPSIDALYLKGIIMQRGWRHWTRLVRVPCRFPVVQCSRDKFDGRPDPSYHATLSRPGISECPCKLAFKIWLSN